MNQLSSMDDPREQDAVEVLAGIIGLVYNFKPETEEGKRLKRDIMELVQPVLKKGKQ